MNGRCWLCGRPCDNVPAVMLGLYNEAQLAVHPDCEQSEQARIDASVAAAPPLSDAQRDRLAVLLNGGPS